MAKIKNPMFEREDSIISADYETTNECCMFDEDDSEKTEKVMTLRTIVENTQNRNDANIEIENNSNEQIENNEERIAAAADQTNDAIDGRVAARKRTGHACGENGNNWAEHKNVAEGLMDIALLSANANQLRFLITYNNKASTYFISLGLVVLSLTLQVAVGIALIFKRRIKRSRIKKTHYRIHEFLIGGVFMVTVINVLLAAFTTTDNTQN